MRTLLFADLMAIDPNVKPNAGFFPFMGALRDAAGGILMVVIILSVILLIAAAITLAWAKGAGAGRMSDKSASILLWVLVGAAIAGSASGIIKWVTNIPLGF